MTSEYINLSAAEWRRKAREGALSVDDMRLALESIRAERIAKAAVSVKSGEKKREAAAKKAPVDSDALLQQLSGL